MRITVIGAMLGAALFALAGCGERRDDQPKPQAIETAPDVPAGIIVSDATVQLPVVAGRPGVAYFTVSQATGAPRAIVGVAVAGAGRAEMHETMEMDGMSAMKPIARIPIEPGKSVEFAPGGKHVMLFDVDPKLAAGGETDLVVKFAEGDTATVKAKVTSLGTTD